MESLGKLVQVNQDCLEFFLMKFLTTRERWIRKGSSLMLSKNQYCSQPLWGTIYFLVLSSTKKDTTMLWEIPVCWQIYSYYKMEKTQLLEKKESPFQEDKKPVWHWQEPFTSMRISTCSTIPFQQWIQRWQSKFMREWFWNYGKKEKQWC